MSPIRSYLCESCNYEYDEIQSHEAPTKVDCPRCEGHQCAYRVPTTFGGYTMASGGSSTRPRGVYKTNNVLKFSSPEKKAKE